MNQPNPRVHMFAPTPDGGSTTAEANRVQVAASNLAQLPAEGTKLTGAQAIVKSLEAAGAEVAFGIPGGFILPTYDPLYDSRLRHILTRHEQGAGHAATGYAQATGKVGVMIATSGPGATNLVTALADANMDSVPVVAITGQVNANTIGTDGFQEADIVGVTMPVIKHSYLVKDPNDIASSINEAFHIAATGRPGPVLVDITKSAQTAELDWHWDPTVNLPGYNPVTRPHHKQIREAARLLATAKRPVIYAGGGILRSGAWEHLHKLVEISGAPIVTTLMGRGGFPDSHPQHLGMPGMHGTVAAVAALQKADVIVALGTRFSDRVTGQLSTFAPKATVVHADIDPAEIGKNRQADVPIVGDLKQVISELIPALEQEQAKYGLPDLAGWWHELEELRATYPLGYTDSQDGLLTPQYVIDRLGALNDPDTIFATGVGQHQMWASQFIKHERPRNWICSGGLGTMGFGVPAAMGAKVGRPDATVWAVDGDGCFQMTNQELATCVINNIPIKVAVINNSVLGMVRQWQTLFYDERYSNTNLQHIDPLVEVPDIVKLAEAYSAVGLRATKESEVDEVIKLANQVDDRPVVVDFRVSRDEMVWPMVPAGLSNDQLLYARGITPLWDRTEG